MAINNLQEVMSQGTASQGITRVREALNNVSGDNVSGDSVSRDGVSGETAGAKQDRYNSTSLRDTIINGLGIEDKSKLTGDNVSRDNVSRDNVSSQLFTVENGAISGAINNNGAVNNGAVNNGAVNNGAVNNVANSSNTGDNVSEDNWWTKYPELSEFAPQTITEMQGKVGENKLAQAYLALMKEHKTSSFDIPKDISGYEIDTKPIRWEELGITVDNLFTEQELEDIKRYGIDNKLTQKQIQSLYDRENHARFVRQKEKELADAEANKECLQSLIDKYNIGLTAEEQGRVDSIKEEPERKSLVGRIYNEKILSKIDEFKSGCEYFCNQLYAGDKKVNPTKIFNALIEAFNNGIDVTDVMYAFGKCKNTGREPTEIIKESIQRGHMPSSSATEDILNGKGYNELMGLASTAIAQGRDEEARYYEALANEKKRISAER